MSIRTSRVGAASHYQASGNPRTNSKKIASTRVSQDGVEELNATTVMAHRYDGDGTQEFFSYDENKSHLNEIEGEAQVFVEGDSLLKTLIPNALEAIFESGVQEEEISQSESEKIKYVAQYERIDNSE